MGKKPNGSKGTNPQDSGPPATQPKTANLPADQRTRDWGKIGAVAGVVGAATAVGTLIWALASGTTEVRNGIKSLEAADRDLRTKLESHDLVVSKLTNSVNGQAQQISIHDGRLNASESKISNHDSRLDEIGEKLRVTVSVPIGGIVMFYGTMAEAKALVEFEVCDGNAPITPDSIYKGNKPNLVDRFLKGSLAEDARKQPPGGSNDFPRHKHRIGSLAATSTSTVHDPGHPHGTSNGGIGGSNKLVNYVDAGVSGNTESSVLVRPNTTGISVVTGTSLSGHVGEGGFFAEEGGEGMNQPAYIEAIPLIRVK